MVKRLGSVLRRYRMASHLTQKELAATLGITREHYSRLENDLKTPSFLLLTKMCSTMKLDLNRLLVALGDSALTACGLCMQLGHEQRELMTRLVELLTRHDSEASRWNSKSIPEQQSGVRSTKAFHSAKVKKPG